MVELRYHQRLVWEGWFPEQAAGWSPRSNRKRRIEEWVPAVVDRYSLEIIRIRLHHNTPELDRESSQVAMKFFLPLIN